MMLGFRFKCKVCKNEFHGLDKIDLEASKEGFTCVQCAKKDDPDQPTHAICSCGWEGRIEECGTYEDQDGWENPTYIVNTCPKCSEDIENYTRKD
jgi:hypothetical protein